MQSATQKKPESRLITIADGVTLDLMKLVRTRMLVQANSGGGKSTLVRLIAEQASGFIPLIILDWEGEFITLREKIDVVLVGADGEISVDNRSAGLLARKLIELRASAVIDLGDLDPEQKRDYVRRFLDSLVNLPRSLWHPTIICVDEAHQYCPEKGKASSTQAVINLMCLGRKRGYSGILVTQRFSKLHKDAASECNNVFIGRTWLDIDQTRAGDHLGFNANERRNLRNLSEGEFFAFGPALLPSGVIRFQAHRPETEAPEVGERHKLALPNASDVVRQIVEHLADLPKQAEEEIRNLEEAQRRIGELEKQNRQLERRIDSHKCETLERVEVPVIKPADIEQAQAILALLELTKNNFQVLVNSLDEATKPLRDALAKATMPQRPTAPARIASPPRVIPLAQVANALPARPASANSDLKINATQQRILDALAFYESIGVYEPSNLQVGAIALIDSTGGHFSNTVGPLSSGGLILRSDGRMRLTDEGRALASVPDRVATLRDYHEMLRARIRRARSANGKTIEMLNTIIHCGGAAVTTEEIGRIVGIDHTGGHFSNTIGPLSTLGFIERRQGLVRPTEILFPHGLK